MNKNLLKSIGAIFLGFVVVLVLSVVTDLILERIGFLPPADQPGKYMAWMLVIALIYRSIYTVAGGYISAMLAPTKPMRHVVILGIIGTIFGTLGTIANWKLATESGTWYPILLLIVSFPCIILGGKLRVSKKSK